MPAPTLKEWGVVACALFDGEQITDVRKGGLPGEPVLPYGIGHAQLAAD